jgi:hypothetical protein
VDTPYDDTRVRRQLDQLRRELDRLRSRIDDVPKSEVLERQRRELKDDIDGIRRHVKVDVDDLRRHLTDRIDDLQEELTDRIQEATTKEEQERAALDRRLRAVQQSVRAAAGSRTVQLHPTPELLELARQADRGAALNAELLEPHRRTLKRDAVTAWERWQAQHRSHTAAAIAASRAVADTAPGQPERTSAESAYRAARGALAELAERHDRTQQAAAAATHELARDDALRHTHTTEIAKGQRAWAALITRLRTQLAESVSRGELPPAWFDIVLGPAPTPDTHQWLEAATQLLAYRATYGIDDPLVALGPSPDSSSSDRQREWHSTLNDSLSRYH